MLTEFYLGWNVLASSSTKEEYLTDYWKKGARIDERGRVKEKEM
jgi:hypothetical protein